MNLNPKTLNILITLSSFVGTIVIGIAAVVHPVNYIGLGLLLFFHIFCRFLTSKSEFETKKFNRTVEIEERDFSHKKESEKSSDIKRLELIEQDLKELKQVSSLQKLGGSWSK